MTTIELTQPCLICGLFTPEWELFGDCPVPISVCVEDPTCRQALGMFGTRTLTDKLLPEHLYWVWGANERDRRVDREGFIEVGPEEEFWFPVYESDPPTDLDSLEF